MLIWSEIPPNIINQKQLQNYPPDLIHMNYK